MKKARIKVT